jgi:hypothetical protein
MVWHLSGAAPAAGLDRTGIMHILAAAQAPRLRVFPLATRL